MEHQFEWDEEKDRANRKKHGVSFLEAKTVFGDPFSLTIEDPDHSLAEDRWIEIGMSADIRLLVVWYTDRRSSIRIIGSRTATATERRDYEDRDPFTGVREMRPEYDFSGGERGKHYEAYRTGHTVRIEKSDGTVEVHEFSLAEGAVMVDPDLREQFPDSESVNKALRSLLTKE